MQPTTASIWIDDDEAVIRSAANDGHAILDRLVRHHGESPMAFDVRVVDEVREDEHLEVDGPDRARLRFERAYVSVTHRPDRLVDAVNGTDIRPPRR